MGAHDTSRCCANRCRNARPCRPDHRGRGNGPFAPWYGRCHRRPCAWRPCPRRNAAATSLRAGGRVARRLRCDIDRHNDRQSRQSHCFRRAGGRSDRRDFWRHQLGDGSGDDPIHSVHHHRRRPQRAGSEAVRHDAAFLPRRHMDARPVLASARGIRASQACRGTLRRCHADAGAPCRATAQTMAGITLSLVRLAISDPKSGRV